MPVLYFVPLLVLTVSIIRQAKMKATIATPAQAVNLRGMQTRAAFHGEGLAKPMTWILRYYPEMSEEEKSLLRFWLLGRAPASMPEDLMRKAESALQRLKAA